MKKKFLPAYLLTFVNTLGFSILIPVLPFIVVQYGAPKYVYGLLLSLYSAFQFIGSPYLGKLSDRKGRKPILLISQIGTLLSWVIFGIAYFLPADYVFIYALPLWVIAISRILDGITGGNVSVTNAYISDITTTVEKRTIFGFLGGIAGIGIIVGPGIGGFASSSSLGYLGTILIALAVSTITVLAIVFFLKESLVKTNKKAEPAAKTPLLDKILVSRRIKSLNPKSIVKKIFLLRLIMGISLASYISTVALFVIDIFDWNEKEVGVFMLFVGLFLSFNQAFVYRRVVNQLGEVKTLALGFLLMAIGFIAITLTNDVVLFVLLYFILNLGISISMPVFNSVISQKANEEKIGEAMGISESIGALSNATFPVIAALTYSVIFYKFYYVLSAVSLVGFYLSFKMAKKES